MHTYAGGFKPADPDHHSTLAQRAFFLWRASRHEEAAAIVTKVMAMGLSLEMLLTFWGRVYFRSGVREELLSCLRSLRDLAVVRTG